MGMPAAQTELRILLLEDVPTDAELVENALREAGLSFISRRVDKRETFVQALDEFKPDIVLADYKLPAFDGASAVKIARQQHPAVPVVMVTGAIGDEMAVELLKLGAKDYILKDRLARLGPAVQRALSAEQGIRARKAAERALRESEAKFRAVVETSSDCIWEIDERGVYTYANPRMYDLLGYTPDEVTSKMPFDLMPVDEAKHMRAIFGSIAAERKPFQLLENTCLHKDGHAVILETSGVPVFDASGVFRGYRGIDRDITQRKQAEARIQKLSRLYATLSQTNKTIVRTTNREELFGSICKGAVEHGKFVLAWVGLADKTTRMVKPICHYGAEQGYLTDIVISTGDVPEGRGPTGTAIRENRVFYVNDFAADEHALPWREAALKRGFRGAAGLPLRFGNEVIGALTLYANEPGFFDTEQLNLLEEMAADISFALDSLEREALRKEAERGREAALQKLRKALEDSIHVAASISEVRDPYTAGHQQRVSELAAAIAGEMGLLAPQIDGIRFGALIHDIGKIGVPAEILSKPLMLTPLERSLVQTHPKAGHDVVKDIEFPWPVARMILQHHERLDGSGYPAGLKGEEIIIEAKIIAVADVVEAMWSNRPYRPGLGMEAALAEIAGGSGVRYDRQAVDACLRLIREKGFGFKTG